MIPVRFVHYGSKKDKCHGRHRVVGEMCKGIGSRGWGAAVRGMDHQREAGGVGRPPLETAL